MKIDKPKLNTLLRSGLNPEIKTRKQLAAQLGMDPTSLTRWFANRDRLGNPRYPVVPDRHVTKIMALFNLAPECLSMDDEEFRQHCFQLSMENSANQQESRLEQIAKRKMTIGHYAAPKSNKLPLLLATIIGGVGIGWLSIYAIDQNFWQSPPKAMTSDDTKCWSGYSSSLGDFEQPDVADPCHYSKLLHNAINQLKRTNTIPTDVTSGGDFSAGHGYVLFLSEQLDQRRHNNKITLNIELGKSEMRRLNYVEARKYFDKASAILAESANPNAQLVAEIATYTAQIDGAKQ